MPQEDELTPTSPENTEGDVPLLDHKSGMFRPVGEDLPIHADEENSSVIVVEATSAKEAPVAEQTVAENTVAETPVVETPAPVAPVVEEAPMIETIEEQTPPPPPIDMPKEAPVVVESPSVQQPENIPPQAPLVRDSGMGDPNTPSVAPTVVVAPVLPVKPHGTSWTRILLLLIFLGALGFLGYKYRYAPTAEVMPTPELPVETGAVVADASGSVATGAEEVATGENTAEGVAENTGTLVVGTGLQTFVATDRSPIATFQYPPNWVVTLSEMNWLKSARLYDDQEVLQAKLLIFGADQMEQHLLAQDALQSIRISEKPFINEGLAGSIGIYSGGVDPLIIPSITGLAQPIILFADKQNEVNYMLILQPNMHKEMFAVMRSLRLP